MHVADTHRAIDAVWRIESAKLIAGLTRLVRDVGLAEDLAQDALLIALEKWPETGVPDNPGAWLMATAGDDWMRPALCEDALRLGRILAELSPNEAEVHGLVALIEIQASRLRARTGPSGEPILLLDQDRARWDHLLIGRGLAALDRAESLQDSRGPYTLQAAIAACHARARKADETNWNEIAALYDELARVAPSPVVELNRAVAVGMAFGPLRALEIVDGLGSEPTLKSYHLLPAVRGDLLAKLGRDEEAREEFARAASLTRNARERELLLARSKGATA